MINLQMLIQKNTFNVLSSCCPFDFALWRPGVHYLVTILKVKVSCPYQIHMHFLLTFESLGSSPVKMSQAFHDLSITSICFNFLYFHRKVNTFKTPEMCLYLDPDVWAGCFTIIFAGSFHYFKPVSCWILFSENVAGVPGPLRSISIARGKGKHV